MLDFAPPGSANELMSKNSRNRRVIRHLLMLFASTPGTPISKPNMIWFRYM